LLKIIPEKAVLGRSDTERIRPLSFLVVVKHGSFRQRLLFPAKTDLKFVRVEEFLPTGISFSFDNRQENVS